MNMLCLLFCVMRPELRSELRASQFVSFCLIIASCIYTIGHQERSDRRLSSLKIEPVHLSFDRVWVWLFCFSVFRSA